MQPPLRLLFLHDPMIDGQWSAGFDLAQAAAALDIPVEIALAGPGLSLLLAGHADPVAISARKAFASLELLGVDQVLAPAPCPTALDSGSATLKVRWLDASNWQHWLRQAAVQVW
jgi:hypothetical protein